MKAWVLVFGLTPEAIEDGLRELDRRVQADEQTPLSPPYLIDNGDFGFLVTEVEDQ